jgi:hypothetical protein
MRTVGVLEFLYETSRKGNGFRASPDLIGLAN